MERCATGKHTRNTTSQWNVWFLLQTWQHKRAAQPRLKPSLRCYISFLTPGQWTSTPNNPLFLCLNVAPSFRFSFPQREKGPRQQINASFLLCGGVLAEVVIMVRGRWVCVFNSVEGGYVCRCALHHHPQWRIKKNIQPQSYGFKESELLCISGKGSGLSTNILWKQINGVSGDFFNSLPPNFAHWGGGDVTLLIPVLSVLLFSNFIRSPSLLKSRLFMQPSSVAIWKATVF